MLDSYISYALYSVAGALLAGGYVSLTWHTAAAIIKRRTYVPLLIGFLARLGLIVSAGLVIVLVESTTNQIMAIAIGFLIARIALVKAIPFLVRRPDSVVR